MVKKYRRKPIEVEAIQWNGENFEEIKKFCKNAMIACEGELIIPNLKDGKFIKAMHVAMNNDFVIKENEEFYFCNPKTFNALYEEVKEKYKLKYIEFL